MDDLVKFLRDRLDEDQRAAQNSGQASLSWQNLDMDGELRDDDNAGTVAYVPREGTRTHIARHDPARVLAEVEAKRRLLGEQAKQERDDGCVICDAGNQSCGCMGGTGWSYPCDTLKLLALPYAGHEAYREEWRP